MQLLTSEWCAPCRDAEEVWRAIADRRDIAFEVLDVAQPEGRAIVSRLGVRTIPSTIIDGMLGHIGVPSPSEATALVAAAPERAAGPPASRYVGMSLEATSAWSVVSAVFYLALGGAALVFGGGIDGDPPWRAAALHVYGMGFIAFVVLGLGEHLLPRFTGAPIRAGASAWWQFGLVHAATLLIAAGALAGARAIEITGGCAALAAFALFAWRLVPVLRARRDDGPDPIAEMRRAG
ncbi:MAG TPA: thioredoxin family protein [Casimicrobiaceae bacterium]